MPKIKHIAISTQDVDKTAKYYIEVFGMKEIARVNSPGATGYYLSDGDLNLAILTFKNDQVAGVGAAADGIGNGRAAAILLAKTGVRVVVVDQAAEPAARTVSMIKTVGGDAVAFVADVTKPEDCRAAVEAALDRFGRLDLLDNNVGIGSRGSVVDESPERWRRIMQVNVETMFLVAKHAIPAMI